MTRPRYRLLPLLLLIAGCDGSEAESSTAAGSHDAVQTSDVADVPIDAAQSLDSIDAADDDVAVTVPPNWCTGGVGYRYDPLAGDEQQTLPDDIYTAIGADTDTGLRVTLGEPAWLTALPDSFRSVYSALSVLDGWGLNGGIQMRFSVPLELPDDFDGVGGPVGLYALLESGPEAVPLETRPIEDSNSTVFWPLVPLREATQHVMVVRSNAGSPEVECIRASPTLKQLLVGTAEGPFAALAPRYAQALSALDLRAEDVGAAVVFTTQSAVRASVDAAASVAELQFAWDVEPVCTDVGEGRRHCQGTFKGHDYRHEDGGFGPEPTADWSIPVDIRLPAGAGPFPVVVFGHGINSSRGEANNIAKLLGPLGIAVVAIDAPYHGEHPTAEPGQQGLDAALKLLGADLEAFSLDALAIRNNMRQAASDKLQLMRLLALHADVDGDDVDDLNMSKLGYVGISLGGLMGAEPAALHPRVSAVHLAVAGGRLTTIFADSDIMSIFMSLLRSLADDPADADRVLPVVQAILDAGDPAVWANHILARRLNDGAAPAVLLTLGTQDEVIPMTATHALARAFGLPVVEPVLVSPGVVSTASPPLSANFLGATAGLFQYDRVRDSADANVQIAMHPNTPHSYESKFQVRHFFETWLNDGTAEIVNPYDELATPPLD